MNLFNFLPLKFIYKLVIHEMCQQQKRGFFYQFIKRIDIKRINPFLIDIDTIRENIFSISLRKWK